MNQKNLFIAVMLLLSGVYSKDGLTDPLDTGVPLDAGVSNSPRAWGKFIPEALAGVIWPLVVFGYSIQAWKNYLGQWTTWEWSCWAAPYPHRGVLYSEQEWYDWYVTNEQTWSSLSWTLHFLGLSPLQILRIVRQQLNRVGSRL